MRDRMPPSETLRHYRGSPLTGSPNRRVSGFGTLWLRPNPAYGWTSDTRHPLSEMPTSRAHHQECDVDVPKK